MRPSTVYVGDGRALTRLVNGHLMYVLTRDLSLGPWLMLDGTWENEITAIFETLVRPGMTVVEVGANVGYFTLLAAKLVGPRGRVHAFEPDPEVCELLRDNVEINGYDDRVRVRRAAVGEAAGRATFHAATRHRGNGSLIPALNQLGDASAEIRAFEVELTALDACEIERLDLLKVDAEGSEARVFRGAARTIARSGPMNAVVEFWPRFFRTAGEDPRAFLAARRGEGFAIERVDKEHGGGSVAANDDEVLAHGVSELVLRRA
jgi:FkbM family methyltransferase